MARKKKLDTSKMEITDKYLESLYERCDGRRSHYLILTDEPQDYLDYLEQEGWIKWLGNSEKRPWYTATVKLITKFRPLDTIEAKQVQNQLDDEALEAAIDEAELERIANKQSTNTVEI